MGLSTSRNFDISLHLAWKCGLDLSRYSTVGVNPLQQLAKMLLAKRNGFLIF